MNINNDIYTKYECIIFNFCINYINYKLLHFVVKLVWNKGFVAVKTINDRKIVVKPK